MNWTFVDSIERTFLQGWIEHWIELSCWIELNWTVELFFGSNELFGFLAHSIELSWKCFLNPIGIPAFLMYLSRGTFFLAFLVTFPVFALPIELFEMNWTASDWIERLTDWTNFNAALLEILQFLWAPIRGCYVISPTVSSRHRSCLTRRALTFVQGLFRGACLSLLCLYLCLADPVWPLFVCLSLSDPIRPLSDCLTPTWPQCTNPARPGQRRWPSSRPAASPSGRPRSCQEQGLCMLYASIGVLFVAREQHLGR